MAKQNLTRSLLHYFRSDSELPPDSLTLQQAPLWTWAIRNLCQLKWVYCYRANKLSTEDCIYYPILLFAFQFSFDQLGKKNSYRWTPKEKKKVQSHLLNLLTQCEMEFIPEEIRKCRCTPSKLQANQKCNTIPHIWRTLTHTAIPGKKLESRTSLTSI